MAGREISSTLRNLKCGYHGRRSLFWSGERAQNSSSRKTLPIAMSDSKNDHKRKQPVMESEETQYPNKSSKNVQDNQQARASSSKKKNSKNKKKLDKNN